MYLLGWEMGAVEAISLSILVGSSVDYCLHLVEGYLLAWESVPSTPGHTLVCVCSVDRRYSTMMSNLIKLPSKGL